MPLPESGPISMSQVATEFGVSQADISLANLGTYIDIESGPVALSDFYGTSGNTPTVATSAPSSVTSTSMTLNGNVTNQGASSVTNRGFYFGTNSNYASNTKTQVGSGTGTYTLAKTGLTAGTTYYITAYAINTQGEARGSTVSQGTTGGTATSGSAMRYGTTNNLSIDNRIISPSTEEPTTGIRLTHSSTFTVNIWLKVGWTAALNSQGRHQFLWGVSANAINSTPNDYTTNVYNNNWRLYYDEHLNRINISFLGKQSNGSNSYRQNFWWLHNTSGTPNPANVTGLGSNYWSNTNRGDVNDNDFSMLTITYNGSMSSSNVKCYWNGSNIGTAYWGSGQNSGTPVADTDQVRLQALLGTAYGPNNVLTGTGDQTAGYFGGNGNTYIDQYSLWDSALSATAVANLWNEGAGGSISTTEQPSGLIVYYNMNSNYQTASPKSFGPVWPTSNGEFYISGSSDFGSGTNTVSG